MREAWLIRDKEALFSKETVHKSSQLNVISSEFYASKRAADEGRTIFF